MNDLTEVTIPHTSNGAEHGEWAKLLDNVDPEARDGYGFDGIWIKRGSVTDLLSGAVILECAGYRTKREENESKPKLYVLWSFDGDTWNQLGQSRERDWAKKLRDAAILALEEE